MLDLLNEGPQRAATPVGTITDIEDCWEIEDTRTPSESPMISAMRNGNSPLGYDAASNTFYCTLGMNTQDVWPELSLFADSSDSSLQIAWVDNYAYDSCEDAIREGYRYELIAYTDQVYDYFGIVFTGLPLFPSIHRKMPSSAKPISRQESVFLLQSMNPSFPLRRFIFAAAVHYLPAKAPIALNCMIFPVISTKSAQKAFWAWKQIPTGFSLPTHLMKPLFATLCALTCGANGMPIQTCP